jgi:hypothetical protein
MLPINNKFPQNIFKKSLSNILDTSSIKTALPNISPNTLNINTNTNTNTEKQTNITKENSIGYNINYIFEPVCITLDGAITCAGSITLDIGVWIINYGINFTTGSGDTNGANIYRIQYGISDNQENIPFTNKTDISKLCVVTFQKPYFENGSVFIATNTESKTYYLLSSILATGETLVFGGNISATRIA